MAIKTPTKKPHPLILILILGSLGLISFSVFIALIECRILIIPYVSPFIIASLKYFVLIMSPLIPLFGPIYLGVFSKVWKRRDEFPKNAWRLWLMFVVLTGSQHWVRGVDDMWRLFGESLMTGDKKDVCGLEKCWGEWEQLAAFAWVVGGELMGWRWDAGYVGWWVESVRKEAEKNLQKVTDTKDLEKGLGNESQQIQIVNEKQGSVAEEVKIVVEQEHK